MLGLINCMHWEWKNCPTAWHGVFQGKEKVSLFYLISVDQISHHDWILQAPKIVLRAVASYDRWIWHTYFGMPGSNNDIFVLDASPVFKDIVEGRAPKCKYTINGNSYHQGYYLANGIYPDYSTLVKTISQPQGLERKVRSD
jgi:hypothetical protein